MRRANLRSPPPYPLPLGGLGSAAGCGGSTRMPDMLRMRLRPILNIAMLHTVTQCPRTPTLMYVCLCNALTDRDLLPHTATGNSSVSMVYQACGCRPQCGKC